MATFSEQFSLREIVGNLAPGAIVLSSIFYVFSKTWYYRELVSGDSASNNLLKNEFILLVIAFVTSYGIGMLLTSLTQTIFNAVTKLGIGARGSTVGADQEPKSKLMRASGSITKLLKRFITHLSGGQGITSTIREFRASWQEQAVTEGVISEKAFNRAADHYRSLLNSEPAGEESLFYCELFIRDRLPTAALEIEQNAAKAALMGNLIIPVLCWLIAIGIGLTIAVFKDYSQVNQKTPELQKLELDIKQVKETQQYQQQQQQHQSKLLQSQQNQMEDLIRQVRSLPRNLGSDLKPELEQLDSQYKNAELVLKHVLERLELQQRQLQEQQLKKQKSGSTALAELLIFAVLLTIFPYIVRTISRLWIEASRNYVRSIILSFSLASSKPSTEPHK
ncbi:MAG TPA: hypothetical protein VJ302_24965, partial [Blastocatellia bacterium]|nr:hypothetical protein [Blastocatellia bacterium]